MTPHEQQLLTAFLDRLAQAQAGPKDALADQAIRQRLAGQPDAAYLLVQRALLLEQALEAAQAQIAALQAQQAAPATGGSFLGGGSTFPSAPYGSGYSAQAPAAPEGFGRAPSQAYDPGPVATPRGWRDRLFGAGPAAAPAPAPAAPSAGGSWLGTAASAAAGVAGGMFLYNGIENLMGHHGGMAGSNSLFGGSTPVQETTVVENITNNYGADDRSGLGQGNWSDITDDLGPGDGFDDDGTSFI